MVIRPTSFNKKYPENDFDQVTMPVVWRIIFEMERGNELQNPLKESGMFQSLRNI